MLLGTYNELTRAIEDRVVDLVEDLDILDALQDVSAGPDADLAWVAKPSGGIDWDSAVEQPYERRIKLLAKNNRIGRLLKKINTLESHNLLNALSDCATATDKTEWAWEVTKSGTVIRPDYQMPDSKGVRRQSPGQQPWGRSIEISLKIIYLPELEEGIVAGAVRSEDDEPANIRRAILAHVNAALSRPALERAGLLAVEISAHNSEPIEIPEELRQLILSQEKSEPVQ